MTSEVENISSGVEKMNVNDGGGSNDESNERGRRRRDEPIMVKRGETGTVKWFSFKSGYGFIAIDNSDEEVFVHSSAIVTLRKVFCVLHENDRVEFDVIQGLKGLEAIAVTGIGGRRTGGVRFGDRGGPGRGPPPPPGRDVMEKRGGGGGGGGGARRRRNTSQGSVEKNNENGGDSGAERENQRGGGRGGGKPSENGRDRPRKRRSGKRSGSEKFVDAKGSPEDEGGEN